MKYDIEHADRYVLFERTDEEDCYVWKVVQSFGSPDEINGYIRKLVKHHKDKGSVLGEFDWSAWSSLRIGIYIHGRSAILNLDDWAECLVGQHEVEWFDHHGLEMLFDYDD